MKQVRLDVLIDLLSQRYKRGYVYAPEVLLKNWMDRYGENKPAEKENTNDE